MNKYSKKYKHNITEVQYQAIVKVVVRFTIKKTHGKKKRGLKLFILLASYNGNNFFFFIKLRQEFCFLKRKAMEYLSEYFLSKGCVLMFCAYLSQSHKRGHSNG